MSACPAPYFLIKLQWKECLSSSTSCAGLWIDWPCSICPVCGSVDGATRYVSTIAALVQPVAKVLLDPIQRSYRHAMMHDWQSLLSKKSDGLSTTYTVLLTLCPVNYMYRWGPDVLNRLLIVTQTGSEIARIWTQAVCSEALGLTIPYWVSRR